MEALLQGLVISILPDELKTKEDIIFLLSYISMVDGDNTQHYIITIVIEDCVRRLYYEGPVAIRVIVIILLIRGEHHITTFNYSSKSNI